MQMRARVGHGQGQLHRVAHAHLVDVAHVEHLDAHVMHQALFAGVHAADADLAQVARVQRRHMPADARQRRRPMPAQTGHRHAVDVATGCERGGVEVGMGIEPEHPQAAALRTAMARHRADGANTQAVVAAQHDRHAAFLQFGMHGIVQQLVPGHDFGQMTKTVHGVLPGIGRTREVAAIAHVHTEPGDGLVDAGHAQRLRAHARAQAAGADIGRCPDQAHATAGRQWREGRRHATGSRCLAQATASPGARTDANRSRGSASVGTSASGWPRPSARALSRMKRSAE